MNQATTPQPPKAGTVSEPTTPARDMRTRFEEVVTAVKPKLRGWIHLGMFPIAIALGIVLISLAPTTSGKITSAVFALTSAMLFGFSALYHRRVWSPKVTFFLRRLDHSNIFLIIAGTYTPLAWALLDHGTAKMLLWVVWIGAATGIALRLSWLRAPRWLFVPLYIALGWVAVWYLPDFWKAANGPGIVISIIIGGLSYTIGAIVYGTKWPDPSPKWFGFHEVFHALTVLGFAGTYVAAFIAVYTSS